jgi:uncharacterized protein (TIGR02118 family)
MIRVNVLYPRREGARFDWAYYLGNRMPMVSRNLGSAVKAISVEQGLSGGPPDSLPPFIAIVHFSFESVGAFRTAFARHAAEIMGDIPNYTSIEPIIQIAEVKMTQ